MASPRAIAIVPHAAGRSATFRPEGLRIVFLRGQQAQNEASCGEAT